MKKAILFFLIAFVIMGILAVSFGSNLVEAGCKGEIHQGHRLYDENGHVNGCQSPGTDCEYCVEIRPPVE